METLFQLAVLVLIIAGSWKTYQKAGEPGWAVLIPFYNLWVLLRIVDRPGWWFIMFLIPLVNLVFMLLTFIDLSRRFGMPAVFSVGLFLLPFVFWPILGFGNSRYNSLAM
ncbi:DUF5684 domain-containing protein [Desulfovibrio oxyclinae]|jgi:hypothetical protein|uniref:DUF5684 domain-containing protein n=1 Tax=Desulfovibrio oxyclinae TaxID=63560 RepID=UPI0003677C9D|nr:DUF5684 domain-containing protein [Desulfovibrio oxyclinae]